MTRDMRASWAIPRGERKHASTLVLFCLPALICLLLAGCGSSASGSSALPTYAPSAASPPTCAHAGRAIALPRGFPSSFPLPKGTALTSWGRQGPATVVHGIVPGRSFRDAASFFPREVRNAGFKVVYSEADVPRDAEGSYRGKGYAGRWTLEHITGCPGAIKFAAFAQAAKT